MQTLSRWITRSYKYMIAAWIVLVVMMAFLAVRLPSILEGDGFEMDAEYSKVLETASETFGVSANVLFLIFDQVDDQRIEQSIAKVDELGIITNINSPLSHPNQYTDSLSYAMLQFGSDADMDQAVAQIRQAIAKDDGVVLTGQAAVSKDISTASQRDLMVSEAIGLPIAIIVLLFAFGTVVASIIPLLIGLSAAVITLGILTILGDYVTLSVFILNIVPMLGLALSIDFALLFISRYREERKKSDIAEAINTTMMTAGRAIIFSAFCVFIGLGAMLLVKVNIFRDIAIGGMLIVLLSVLCSITLLPSILIALGDRLNKWQLLRIRQNGANRWRTFAQAVIKRPVLMIIAALIILGTALLPVFNMDLAIPQIDSLPESYDSRQAYEKMQTVFGLGNQSDVQIIATRSGGWQDSEGLSLIRQWQKELQEDPLVGDLSTIFTLSGIDTPEQWEQMWQSPQGEQQLKPLWDSLIQGDQLFLPFTLQAPGSADVAQDWVRDFSSNYSSFNEVETMVGGSARFNQEIFDEIADTIGLVLLVIMLSTFVVLLIAFRSLLIPIKAILMNMIGLAATFGILVYIFQYGHFGLPAGTIALIIPVIVFSLVFGLSMDYEVFLISRMQEEYAKTLDNDHATVEGLAVTSKIITSAALIMIVLTGSFAIADVMPVKQIGVGIAIAIAIDATIIRLLLVPSLMKLFGKWNWWLPFTKSSS